MLSIIGIIALVLLALAFLPALAEGAGILVGLVVIVAFFALVPNDDLRILLAFSAILFGAFYTVRFAFQLRSSAKARAARLRKVAQPHPPPRAG